MAEAEVAAAAVIERLVAEPLAVKEVVQLTGLDQATVRRLRQPEGGEAPGTEPTMGGGVTIAEGVGVDVAR